MKISNHESIQQKNSDPKKGCDKCNKGSSWLWALVVFINFAFLVSIFHVVWNFSFSDVTDSQNTTLEKLEEVSRKLDGLSGLNSNKITEDASINAVEMLEKAANKYHVALYTFRIIEKLKLDQSVDIEMQELASFEKHIESNAWFQELKKINFNNVSKNKILEQINEFEAGLNNRENQDGTWLGDFKNKIGNLVKIEQKDLVEKNKSIMSNLQNAKQMLEINECQKALDYLSAIGDVNLNSAEKMLEERTKTFTVLNNILREAL